MNQKNESVAGNLTLALGSSSAIEKAKPGATRILSGMIKDTLAQAKKAQDAKPELTVAMCGFMARPKLFDDGVARMLQLAFAGKSRPQLRCFSWTNELMKESRALQFDLFIILLNPHLFRWNSPFEAPRREHLDMADLGKAHKTDAHEFIVSLKREFQKPILTLSNGYYLATELGSAGADAFLSIPPNIDEFLNALKACGVISET